MKTPPPHTHTLNTRTSGRKFATVFILEAQVLSRIFSFQKWIFFLFNPGRTKSPENEETECEDICHHLLPSHLLSLKRRRRRKERPRPLRPFFFPGQLIKVRNAGNLFSSFPPPIPLSPRSGGKIGEKEQADFPYATTKIYYDFLLCHLL